jgi:hypothetical protein
LVKHFEYAMVYSASAKRRTVHGVLVRNLYNDNVESIFFATLQYQGVDDMILENRDLVFVAEDPEARESLERR